MTCFATASSSRRGERLSVSAVEKRLEAAKAGLGEQLDKFARNTLEYLDKERDLLTDELWIPETKTSIYGRHVLVVVRGYDYRQDLDALKSYIRDVRPVLVGVDGGADALLEEGFKPDIVDRRHGLRVGRGAALGHRHHRPRLRRRPHPRARAGGAARTARPRSWPLAGTSEDLALLLAWEAGADLIVAVGTHANLVEFLDKGRGGMASTFLVRLKVGPKLVDAKGVSKLYRSAAGPVETARARRGGARRGDRAVRHLADGALRSRTADASPSCVVRRVTGRTS